MPSVLHTFIWGFLNMLLISLAPDGAGCAGVTSVSFAGLQKWCQQHIFTVTGPNPITAASLCVQQKSRPEVMSLLSSIYAQLWFQLLTFNQTITPVTNAFLWTVRDKPVIAAQQCGETKFPLFETICWTECLPLTGSSCIPAEFTIGQGAATARKHNLPLMGLEFKTSSFAKVYSEVCRSVINQPWSQWGKPLNALTIMLMAQCPA